MIPSPNSPSYGNSNTPHRRYVLCNSCKSPDTLLDRDASTRIMFMRCQQVRGCIKELWWGSGWWGNSNSRWMRLWWPRRCVDTNSPTPPYVRPAVRCVPDCVGDQGWVPGTDGIQKVSDEGLGEKMPEPDVQLFGPALSRRAPCNPYGAKPVSS